MWKLIEKKFRELGEFVEGKEKLKMIVHKVYKSKEELYKIFDYEDEEGDDDDEKLQADQVESTSDAAGILPLDNDLQHDIEELGKEEQAMVLSSAGDDDEPEAEQVLTTQQLQAPAVVEADDGLGRSQEDAIALSDDDDDDDEAVEASSVRAVNLQMPSTDLNTRGSLPDCKVYKLLLKGPSLGVEVAAYKDRVIVSRRLHSRKSRLGEDCKPHVGDILVAVNRQVIPAVIQLEPVLRYLKTLLNGPSPIQLWFVEDSDFSVFYHRVSPPKKRPRPPPQPTEKVVDLIDD